MNEFVTASKSRTVTAHEIFNINGNDYKFDKPYRNLGKASGTVKVTAKWLLTIKGSNYDVSKLNEVSENSLD